VRQHFLQIPSTFCHPADNPHSGADRAGTNDLRAPVQRPVRRNSTTASEQVRIGTDKSGPNGSGANVCPSVNNCRRPQKSEFAYNNPLDFCATDLVQSGFTRGPKILFYRRCDENGLGGLASGLSVCERGGEGSLLWFLKDLPLWTLVRGVLFEPN
jgi:hypothetical protein